MKRDNPVFFAAILVYLVLQLTFLTRLPDIMEDEPWYANTAYNFSLGNHFTNTNVGHQGGDYFIGYSLILGTGISLFGCTLLVTRLISVFGGLLALFGLIGIVKFLKVPRLIAMTTLLIFIFSNVLFIIFRTARPDGWIVTFAIWAIYFFLRFNQSEKFLDLLFGTCLATFSFLVHPNGILFLVNGGIYTLIYAFRNKRYLIPLYFGLIALILIAFHFIISLSNPNIVRSEFYDQILFRNTVSNETTGLFERISVFFISYTLGVKRLYIFLFEIGILLMGIILAKRNSILGLFSLFGLANFLLSMLFFSPYSARHFGEIALYSYIAFPLVWITIKHEGFRRLVWLSGLAFLLNSLAGNGYLFYQNRGNIPYSQVESLVKERIPDGSTVIGSIHIWFPLKDCETYNEYTRYHYKPYENLNEVIKSKEGIYVVHSDLWFKGETGTSGREEEVPPKIQEFSEIVTEAIENRGELQWELQDGYYNLKIYRLND